MTLEQLNKIKDEAFKELAKLDDYNAYARFRNELAEKENIQKMFGILCYTSNLELPEKTESDVIMDVYKKYMRYINEEDTNGIYVRSGTYMAKICSYIEIEEGAPFEIEVDTNDPRATHRYYWNLEGNWSRCVSIEECDQFEKNNTVLYADEPYSPYKVQKEFIVTAVLEDQEKAINKILAKYKKQ